MFLRGHDMDSIIKILAKSGKKQKHYQKLFNHAMSQYNLLNNIEKDKTEDSNENLSTLNMDDLFLNNQFGLFSPVITGILDTHNYWFPIYPLSSKSRLKVFIVYDRLLFFRYIILVVH